MKEARVGIDQLLEIIALHAAFVGDTAAVDAFEQHVGGCLQVDHHVRSRHLQAHLGVDLFIQAQLVVVEVDAREHGVLLQQKIGHRAAGEQVALFERLDLTGALEQKEQLGRERVMAARGVETLQKRIFLRLFEQHAGVEGLGQATGQAGLADADRSFHHQVAGRMAGHGHEDRVVAARSSRAPVERRSMR